MSNDLNKCLFIGRLGADPEIRYTGSGQAVANFRIAVGSSWKDKAGDKQESTEWVSLVAWGKLAEICGEYLVKGKQVFVSGRMQTRKWQDKEGNDRYTTEVVVDEMQMLASSSGGGSERAERPTSRSENSSRGSTTRGGSSRTSGTASTRGTRGRSAPPPAEEADDFDDDIPFGDNDNEPAQRSGGRW